LGLDVRSYVLGFENYTGCIVANFPFVVLEYNPDGRSLFKLETGVPSFTFLLFVAFLGVLCSTYLACNTRVARYFEVPRK